MEKNLDQPNLKQKIFEEELQSSYLDYAMSVITSRAVPDAYDGLKPVQRRILYSMVETNCMPENPHRKSARIVGDVLGKYHPHGDSAIYDAMARMAQDFSIYAPLIDGQGNFGSIDGDKPASMRYTEARLAKIAKYLLEDYDKDTVDMYPNYDGTLEIPEVLPARFPNLLVNGASGIAVGMATSIPTHNLSEVIDATCAFIDNRNLTSIELMQYIPAPDFPLGGVIFKGSGLIDIYTKGRGSFTARGKMHQEVVNGRNALVITSIPYQVNKENLMDKVADLMQTEILNSIHIFRDESNKDGMRVVLELKKDAEPNLMTSRIYKFTQMQVSVHANILALHNNRPKQLNLKQCLDIFLDYREEVLIRKTKFFLNSDRIKAHVLWGLLLAVKKLDEIVHCIKTSKDTQEAQGRLQQMEWSWDDIKGYLNCISESCEPVDQYFFSEEQAKAILNLRLSKLTGLERNKLLDQLEALGENIREYLKILNDRSERFRIIKDDLLEIKRLFGNPRRTDLDINLEEMTDESYITSEDMVVTLSSNKGYVKSMPLSSYRLQKRGGKGKIGMVSDDPVEHMFVANTHQEVIFFSSLGYSYSMKVYRLPTVSAGGNKGRALVNFFPLGGNEKIMSSLALPLEIDDKNTMIFITSKGYVRRNAISDFQGIRSNGKIAMKLGDDERLIGAMICSDDDDMLLTSSAGKVVRFSIKDVRIFNSRSSHGVIGMNLSGDEDNQIVSATLISPEDKAMILTVSENGYGKRSEESNYRRSKRGAKGVSALDVTKKTGKVVGAYRIDSNSEILMMSENGQIIRCGSNEIRVASRKTQGVRLARLDNDKLVKVVAMNEIEIDDKEEGDEENNQ
ncbi:DNA gyrase subunit A [Candidatus Cytomitobacter indipagum]|uniref:DNA topoisomerase (ATP-hydrolyzing) n=1 Tax=Candidatus Cytomitobacter indipagum TaxID=2601575 RepID=A0A5C0UFW1_9PROT|nr:DNA gyrase subunit A [Candidatus Cytomitobacter indipagum]QEK37934.1 DNA gyrase subunit A [Candidatus Cytomitobacter indipagum]